MGSEGAGAEHQRVLAGLRSSSLGVGWSRRVKSRAPPRSAPVPRSAALGAEEKPPDSTSGCSSRERGRRTSLSHLV
ncbi:hypothetical protein P7K49_017912 [Saguinus oedipus]|uniref:Uncharacterized protein n=1 Tax=Saguinus oedipus TaxID=9490 RepID=A0ABQ9V488_SAGOE|nr:hypothetical protein P7K49_017912 [Saguinus oedipus]